MNDIVKSVTTLNITVKKDTESILSAVWEFLAGAEGVDASMTTYTQDKWSNGTQTITSRELVVNGVVNLDLVKELQAVADES